MVYFISDLENKVVKIGVSKSPKYRLKQLQTSNSNKLSLLGYINGDESKEKYLHKLFGEFKLNGEWFSLNKIIIDYINENNIINSYVEEINSKLYALQKIKK